ncbi:MAG: hypothetical protein PHQ59_01940 [Candidatus Daviesbacteria bacterium]|nr:hypothetical protein [Candidatus Daviesbacteria bacterium]
MAKKQTKIKKKIVPAIKPTLTTEKMPGETEQQYCAWLLYVEVGSLRKVLRNWGQDDGDMGAEFTSRLGKKPAESTIERWSRKYRWVDRTELQLTEELTDLKQETDRFRLQRKFLVTDVLVSKLKKLRREAKKTDVTVLDVKYLWEMHRTEFGEATGKTIVSHYIDEKEQLPPTSEENEIGKEIDQLIKNHYGRKTSKQK